MPTIKRLLAHVLILALPLAIAPGCYSTASFYGDAAIRCGSDNSYYDYTVTFAPIKTEVANRAEYVFGGTPRKDTALQLAVSENDAKRLSHASVHAVLRQQDGTVLFDAHQTFRLTSPLAQDRDDDPGLQMLWFDGAAASLNSGGSYHLTIEIEAAPADPVTITPRLTFIRWAFVL